MKKGIVALFIGLALVVLISPGIIGRLAQESVDESLDWAATESSDVVVTSSGFERGWFTSAGQHRIELRKGDLQDMVSTTFATIAAAGPRALIVDTRLDHGLIPVSSMARDHGTLMPGLGSAVSTLSVEFADGSVVDLPGTIYSNVGLTGEIQSNFVLAPEGVDLGDIRIDWGAADFLVTVNPANGGIGVTGELDSLAVESFDETVIVGKIGIFIDQEATPFGFMVGAATITVASVAIIEADEMTTAGPFYIDSNSAIDDERLDADITVRFENTPFADFGSAGIELVARFENVDAAALGRLQRRVESMSSAGDAIPDIERDLQDLLIAGFGLHFDQLDIALPTGQVTSRISAVVAPGDPDTFTWASALLALDASAEISLPAPLVDFATRANPDMHAAIAMGFLRKKGDYYIMEAAFKKGLLTVNGAPMPVPLPGIP